MKHYIKKIVPFFILIGLLIIPQPTLNAHAHDKLEMWTALLRGPAAYLEHELLNDTSRSAHAQKALIAAVRLVNDLNSPTTHLQHHTFGWFVYDAKEILVHLKALLSTKKKLTDPAQSPAEQKLSDNKDHQFFCRFVLPMIEMLGAFGRTEYARSRLPQRGGTFPGIVITLSRLGQLYLAAPQNSTDRKIILALFVWCCVDILNGIKRIYDNAHIDQDQEEQRARQREIALQGIHIIHKNEKFGARPENIRYTQGNDGENECSVCLENPQEPHALNCGHVFCKKCIISWLDKKLKCPYCNQNIPKILYEI